MKEAKPRKRSVAEERVENWCQRDNKIKGGGGVGEKRRPGGYWRSGRVVVSG